MAYNVTVTTDSQQVAWDVQDEARRRDAQVYGARPLPEPHVRVSAWKLHQTREVKFGRVFREDTKSTLIQDGDTTALLTQGNGRKVIGTLPSEAMRRAFYHWYKL